MNYSIILKMKFCILLLLNSTLLYADVRLPSIISDNMVLQQGIDIPIWGWADPEEKVKVEFAGQTRNTVADSKGNWCVKFKPVKAGGPYTLDIQANNSIKLKDILIGEVWVCSGQSNMEWPLSLTDNAKKEILNSTYHEIRLFKVQKAVSKDKAQDCRGMWKSCEPLSVSGFSAVAYFFGREIYDKIKVPVGLIDSSWGGSAAEAWTRTEILKADAEFNNMFDEYETALVEYKSFDNMVLEWKQWERQQHKWAKDVAKAIAEGKPQAKPPEKPTCPQPHMMGAMYNGMISPLIPYAIRGVIWYQGESNAARAIKYRSLFPTMINDWRIQWNQGEFPFLFVQIAPFKHFYGPQEAAELREAQLMTLNSVPNTGMVVTMDIGAVNDIHPRNKQEVGQRLALWALSQTYGQPDIVYSGPLYKSMKIEGGRIRLSFDHIGSGLSSKDGPLAHFTIAGDDKHFVEAMALIEGDTVVVSNEEVLNPQAVRYAWSNAAVPNLFNKEGLPASPFRTDRWTGILEN